MALKNPTTSHDTYEEEGAQPLFVEINTTPLTDIVLVLLIIFMVSSSAWVDAAREGLLDVTLPTASSAASPKESSKSFVVGIHADGRLYVDDTIVSEEVLKKALEDLYQKDPQALLLVRADGDLQHKKVVSVIDLVRGIGFTHVGIETESTGE
jgi:biopolymer transport protein ExbD